MPPLDVHVSAIFLRNFNEGSCRYIQMYSSTESCKYEVAFHISEVVPLAFGLKPHQICCKALRKHFRLHLVLSNKVL